jgi:hypothetical protein
VTLPELPDPAQLRQVPHWVGPALLILALLITVAGPIGLRLMNAVLLGAGAFCAAFFGLRGDSLHEWLHGAVSVPAAMIGLVLGLASPAAGTGVVMTAICAGLGFFVARFFKLTLFEIPAASAGFAGFFWGFTQHKRLSIWLPPIFAALFASAGLQLTWRRAWPPLPTLIATGVLMALLEVLAILRARLVKRRQEAGAKRVADEELRKRVAEQQAEFKRTYGEQ